MSDRLLFEIVTPERLVLSQAVDEVVLPSVEGSMGVLPGHAPLLAELGIGELSYRIGDRRSYLSITGGYAEVLRDSVRVLARTCERAEEIDLERARRSKTQAESALDGAPELEFRRAEVRLKRALARIEVHGRLGT